MPPVPGAVIKERAARLRAAGAAAKQRHLQALVGRQTQLLMERGGIGRTACFAPVRLDGAAGRFVSTLITGAVGGQLIGQLAA